MANKETTFICLQSVDTMVDTVLISSASGTIVVAVIFVRARFFAAARYKFMEISI